MSSRKPAMFCFVRSNVACPVSIGFQWLFLCLYNAKSNVQSQTRHRERALVALSRLRCSVSTAEDVHAFCHGLTVRLTPAAHVHTAEALPISIPHTGGHVKARSILQCNDLVKVRRPIHWNYVLDASTLPEGTSDESIV